MNREALALLVFTLCAAPGVARAEGAALGGPPPASSGSTGSSTVSAAERVTLEVAIETARKNQPNLRRATALTEAAEARAKQAGSGLWPQVTGTAQYQRSTANFAGRPGAGPSNIATLSRPSSFESYNFFNFGLSANQLIYDFGQTSQRAEAAESSARAQAETGKATWLDVAQAVRAAYFTARAQKALVAVARETLANQERHLAQIRGFVEVGTRPEIDLAQGRTDVANARVQLINSENDYASAKASLNQAMGVERDTDYDLADEELAAIPGEDLATDALIEGAVASRPELAALAQQIRAQEAILRANRGTYGPSLSVAASFTEAGIRLPDMAWNWSLGALLNWPIFQGGLSNGLVQEAEATLASLDAQLAALRQSVRLELEQARLRIRASKAAIGAAREAVESARVRVQLAEGRYQAGVGNVIELGDAQLALTSAEAQKIQAEFNLSAARAQLQRALGLP